MISTPAASPPVRRRCAQTQPARAPDALADFRAFCLASALIDANVDHGAARVALRTLHHRFLTAGWTREEVHQAVNYLMDAMLIGFTGEPDGRLFIDFDADELIEYLSRGGDR